MRVTTRQIKTAIVQQAHDLRDGANLQKELENKLKPVPNGQVRIFGNNTARVAHQTNRQGERKFAALRLCDQAGRQAAADRMQLEFGYGPLETEKQAPIRTAGIVDTVAISDEAISQPTDVQKRIPVGTVTREPRHVD